MFGRMDRVVGFVLPWILVAPATAQSWEVLDDISFSENLARNRYFNLASEFLDQVEKQSNADEDRLALVFARAKLGRWGGEYAAVPSDRLTFYDEAVKLYQDFLKQADEDNLSFEDAQRELAATQRSLGTLLAELVGAGIDAATHKAAAETAFRDSVKQLNQIYNEKKGLYEGMLEQVPTPDEVEIEKAQLDAVQYLTQITATYYQWGLLYDEGEFNREDYLTKAIESATEVIWEIGTDMFIAKQVYYYEGLAHLKLGKVDDGMARLEFVVGKETGVPYIVENNPDLPAFFIREATGLMEQAYVAITAMYNQVGKYELAEKYAQDLEAYYKKYRDRGVERSNLGDEVLLELGIAQFRQGKSGGMRVLEDVATRHPHDYVGRRAADYIATILEGDSGGGRTIPPTVWLTAAASDQGAGKNLDAIEKYHNALAALDSIGDEAAKLRTSIDAWDAIGNIYRSIGRNVEAAIAFRQGLNKASGGNLAEDVERLGVAWYNTLLSRQRETKNQRDTRAKDQAMRELSKLGIENMAFLVAKDDFEAARILPADSADRGEAFSRAIAKLKSVKSNDVNYERALVYLARAEAEQGKFGEALKRLKTFEKWVGDSKHDPGLDRKKIQAREISATEATYYKATYQAAENKHDDVLKTLESFEENFANQTKFFKLVNYQRLRSLVSLSEPQLDAAEALYEEKKGEDLPAISQYFLARGFLDTANAMPEDADQGQKKTFLQKGADHLFEYSKMTGFESFRNLMAVADAYEQIEGWTKAQQTYGKVLDVFSGNSAHKKEIDEVVNLRLANVFLSQRDFSGAAPLFKDLVERFPGKREVLWQAARCFGGWVDVIDRQALEVPGSGDYEQAVRLWGTIVERGFPADEKYSAPWWEAKYYSLYSRYRAGKDDPSYLTQAKKLLDNVFSSVISLYPVEEHEELLGGPDWLKRFNYLRDRLR